MVQIAAGIFDRLLRTPMLMVIGSVVTAAFYGLATLLSVLFVVALIFGDPLGHWISFAVILLVTLAFFGIGRLVHHVIIGPVIRPLQRPSIRGVWATRGRRRSHADRSLTFSNRQSVDFAAPRSQEPTSRSVAETSVPVDFRLSLLLDRRLHKDRWIWRRQRVLHQVDRNGD